MITKQIYSIDNALIDFINACDKLGYKNNNSLKALKWDWCLTEGGAWYATYSKDKIISLSGIHPFEDGYRALFRGAQIEKRSCGLNKYHMQSYCFAEQLPLQIEFAGESPIYITTNVETDHSGRMNAVNRTFYTLEKYKLLTLIDCKEVFYTKQNIWKLNVEQYKSKRYT